MLIGVALVSVFLKFSGEKLGHFMENTNFKVVVFFFAHFFRPYIAPPKNPAKDWTCFVKFLYGMHHSYVYHVVINC